MRKIVLALLLTFAITISSSESTLAHQLDTATASVRQSTVTVEAPPVESDDLSNQPFDSDDNHDNT